MKILAALLALIMIQAVPAHAAKDRDSKKSKGSALEEKQAARTEELEGTQWEVTLLSRDPKAKGPLSDKLTFSDGKVTMKLLEDKGFGAAGYTLTAFETSDMGRWETFQNKGKETLSGRGDWYGERMDGVFSLSFEGGKRVETYNFSTQKKTLLPKKEAVSTDGAEQAAGVAAAPAAEASAGVLVSKESGPKK